MVSRKLLSVWSYVDAFLSGIGYTVNANHLTENAKLRGVAPVTVRARTPDLFITRGAQ